ncbi:MAG: hypothetical protein NVSMB65_09310 [Chloroflexota bacterium]
MKITAINAVVVNAVLRNWVFVKVQTDEGVTGWGEASVEWKTRAVAGCVADSAPFIVGQDPTHSEHLYQILARQPFFRGGVVGMSALSGIEQACWDIFGKASASKKAPTTASSMPAPSRCRQLSASWLLRNAEQV